MRFKLIKNMEYTEVRETVDKIIESVQKGNYEVSFEGPNNISSCTAPDGRTFYKFVDMDGVKSSNDFGSCNVVVLGYSFSCDLGTGDYESDFFDELEDEYEFEDGSVITKEELEEEVIDAFNDRDDIWFGEYTDMDWQMDIYAKANKIKDPEYYWCEDPDCPVDIDDCWNGFTSPKDLDYGIVYFERRKYYLVEETNNEDGEQLHAVHCKDVADDHGLFSTVLMTVTYSKNNQIKVTECVDCDDLYNAVEGSME